AELEKQEPIKLQHMAVAADGELRWMTGRKIDNCELYAMPDFGQAPKRPGSAQRAGNIWHRARCRTSQSWRALSA
ncbi:hypothetical protein ACV34Z_32895, partial [Pseudomonas aeruginosa]